MNTQTLSQSFAKISFMDLPRISPRKFLLFGLVLITPLLIFYIFQISEVAKTTFFISKSEKEIMILSQQNKDLEKNLFRENSLSISETVADNFNYEKINKVYYIQVMDGEMAVRR